MIFIKDFFKTPDHTVNMVRRYFSFHILLLLFVVVLLAPSQSSAASTVDCHCFRERSFAPENPSAFDPYLLTTVQNRLLAHAFNLSRKEIVSMKMAGAQGNSLWVAHWVARAAALPSDQIQALFLKKMSWQKVVEDLSVDPEKLGSLFWASLTDNEEELAWAVVSQLCVVFLADSKAVYKALKEEGATLKEAILASVLSGIQKESAGELFFKSQQQGNWGSLIVLSGLSIDDIETFLVSKFPTQ